MKEAISCLKEEKQYWHSDDLSLGRSPTKQLRHQAQHVEHLSLVSTEVTTRYSQALHL